MNIGDVYEAFSGKNTLVLEAAFSILVEWPSGGVLDGLKSAEQYMDLLARLTAALDGDVRFMPAQTCKRIQDTTGQVVFAFQKGARVVADHRDFWRSNFAASPVPPAMSVAAESIMAEQGGDETLS